MQLREKEILFKTIRKHVFSISGPFSVAGGLLIVYFLVVYYFQFNFFGYNWQAFGMLILVLSLFILYTVYIWRKNEFFITNQRLINNEQRGLFSRTVTELMYDDVYEVAFKQDGLTASSLNYGTLVIRTPSENEIVLEMIPEPEKAVELINKIRNSLKHPEHEQDTAL